MSILFDISFLQLKHNGLSRFARNIITHCKELGIEFDVICNSQSILDFHQLTCRIAPSYNKYSVAIRLAQPFAQNQVDTLSNLADRTIYVMHDIIAHTWNYIPDVNRVWNNIGNISNLVFISEYSKSSFADKFPIRKQSFTKLLPTVLSQKDTGSTDYILITGNGYIHKGVNECVNTVRSLYPHEQIKIIGDNNFIVDNIQMVKSGSVPQENIDMLYANSKLIICPSYDEGFGFSITDALQYRKPLLARNISATDEILNTYKSVSGVTLYSNIVYNIATAMSYTESHADDSDCYGWREWTAEFLTFIQNI